MSQTFGPPPWHLWGTSNTVELVTPGGVGVPFPTPQLINVEYARPDTWTFLIEATLLDCTPVDPSPNVMQLIIDLQVGIGRNTITLVQFCLFEWDISGGEVGIQRYVTEVLAPKLRASDPDQRAISSIPAQTLRASARFFWTAQVPAVAHVEMSMQVAPRSHVRPDWFGAPGAQFRGGEDGGR